MYYTKRLEQPLNFIETLQLLEKCIKNDIIKKDPNNKNNIFVYREKGTKFPEGWYSENIHTAAQELMEDNDGQRFLREHLMKNNINLVFVEHFPPCKGEERNYINL